MSFCAFCVVGAQRGDVKLRRPKDQNKKYPLSLRFSYLSPFGLLIVPARDVECFDMLSIRR